MCVCVEVWHETFHSFERKEHHNTWCLSSSVGISQVVKESV